MASPDITVDMGVACSECGDLGAVDNGLCLRCITRALKRAAKGGRMGTKETAAQKPPIPMSDDETRKAGLKLAGLVRELAVMENDHAEIRKEQKLEREKLEQRIADVAASIRDHQGKA